MAAGSGNIARVLMAELARALCVLGLVFLSFAHAPVSVAGGDPGIGALSFCGDPIDGSGGDAAPCQACRLGQGLDLPPPPASISCARVAVGAALLPARATAMWINLAWMPAAPRGPPAVL